MIEIRNISVRFGNKQVLSNYSVDIPDTGIIFINGDSGIGKTTLLRVICGLQKPDHGTVIGLKKRKISYVFQEPRLLDYMSAIQNVAIVSDYARAESLLNT